MPQGMEDDTGACQVGHALDSSPGPFGKSNLLTIQVAALGCEDEVGLLQASSQRPLELAKRQTLSQHNDFGIGVLRLVDGQYSIPRRL